MADTTNPIAAQVPTAWQVYIPMLTSLARDALNLAGSAGFTWALTVNASQVQMGVCAAMIVASVVWGKIQKYQAQKAINTAAASPKNAPAPKLPA